MDELTDEMTRKPDDASLLKRYAQLETRLEILGGYNRDYEINRVCNGLEIPQEMRSQKFSLLSGGEKTRINLARIILEQTDVLLLDEPLGALDAFTRMNMQDEILRIWKETGMTALMITHDVDEAVYLSDKVVVMPPRPGRITGTLDIRLSRPRAPAQSGRRSVRRTVHVFPLQKSESVKKALRIDLNCEELSFYAFGISGCTMQLFS